MLAEIVLKSFLYVAISVFDSYIYICDTSNNTPIRFYPLATLNTSCTLLFSWFLVLVDAGTETFAAR